MPPLPHTHPTRRQPHVCARTVSSLPAYMNHSVSKKFHCLEATAATSPPWLFSKALGAIYNSFDECYQLLNRRRGAVELRATIESR